MMYVVDLLAAASVVADLISRVRCKQKQKQHLPLTYARHANTPPTYIHYSIQYLQLQRDAVGAPLMSREHRSAFTITISTVTAAACRRAAVRQRRSQTAANTIYIVGTYYRAGHNNGHSLTPMAPAR
eukprot:GHVU01041192.1.p2 GENE.GHVU01041192.1~~GHVU01041192.1.p2  ORF type:complete len:127 (+),score=10.42 GHVU01041192.1:320-700(+)